MKIEVKESNEIQVHTEGWVSFGDLLKEAVDYIQGKLVIQRQWEIMPEKFVTTDTTIEIGRYAVEDFNGDVKIAHIGIDLREKEGKREFRILGVDFYEAVKVMSIAGSQNNPVVEQDEINIGDKVVILKSNTHKRGEVVLVRTKPYKYGTNTKIGVEQPVSYHGKEKMSRYTLMDNWNAWKKVPKGTPLTKVYGVVENGVYVKKHENLYDELR